MVATIALLFSYQRSAVGDVWDADIAVGGLMGLRVITGKSRIRSPAATKLNHLLLKSAILRRTGS